MTNRELRLAEFRKAMMLVAGWSPEQAMKWHPPEPDEEEKKMEERLNRSIHYGVVFHLPPDEHRCAVADNALWEAFQKLGLESVFEREIKEIARSPTFVVRTQL